MAILRADAQMLDNSLDDLGNTLFKNRMAKQQQGNFEQEQNRLRQTARLNADERAMMLNTRVGAQQWNESPQNPRNKLATAEAEKDTAAAAAVPGAAAAKKHPFYVYTNDGSGNAVGVAGTYDDAQATLEKVKSQKPEADLYISTKAPEHKVERDSPLGTLYLSDAEAARYDEGLQKAKTASGAKQTVRQVVNPNYVVGNPKSEQFLSETNTTNPLNIGDSGLPNMAPAAAPTPAKPQGQRVRNKKTGQLGTKMPDGTVIPDGQ